MRFFNFVYSQNIIHVFLFLPFLSFSQVNCLEIPEGYTGICNYYYESGAIESQIEVVNGVPTRKGKTFYEDGSLGSEMNMVESFSQDFEASYIVYNPYGDVQFKIELINGNGSCYMANSENNTTITGYYTDNIASDTWSVSDENGKVINSFNATDLEPREFTNFDELMTETATMLMHVLELATTPVAEESFEPHAMDPSDDDVLRIKVRTAYSLQPLSEKELEQIGVVKTVETQADFPGGSKGLQLFLNENVVYPGYAIENDISGRVYVSFVVESDGTVSNIRITKGIHESLDIEALRICFLMPKWTPAISDSKNVVSFCTIPIVFNLTD